MLAEMPTYELRDPLNLHVLAFLCFLATLSSYCVSQQPNSTIAGSNPPAASACGAKVKAAHQQGFDEGVKSANDSCTTKITDGFLKGAELSEKRFIAELGNEDGKIPISLLVEDIPQGDAYRLAAAELLTTYFSKHYVISPTAELMIYISGSQGSQQTVSYEVSMRFSTIVLTQVGTEHVPVYGVLSLSDAAGFMVNYSEAEKTQVVKQALYKVMTEGDAALFPVKSK
jgi:hypothetical protein